MTRHHLYPADIAAEALLIGARLLTEHRPAELARVTVDYFADPRHRLVWRAVERLEVAGRPSGAVAVGDEIGDVDRERIGGWSFLAVLVADSDPTWPLDGLVRALYRTGLRRAVLLAATDISEAAYTARDPVALARWARTRLP